MVQWYEVRWIHQAPQIAVVQFPGGAEGFLSTEPDFERYWSQLSFFGTGRPNCSFCLGVASPSLDGLWCSFFPSASRTMATEATFRRQCSSASGNWGCFGRPKTPSIESPKRRWAGGSLWLFVCSLPEQHLMALPTSVLLRKWAKRTGNISN